LPNNCAALIEAHQVKRVLADIDADWWQLRIALIDVALDVLLALLIRSESLRLTG
jgi:hypothetical protein